MQLNAWGFTTISTNPKVKVPSGHTDRVDFAGDSQGCTCTLLPSSSSTIGFHITFQLPDVT